MSSVPLFQMCQRTLHSSTFHPLTLQGPQVPHALYISTVYVRLKNRACPLYLAAVRCKYRSYDWISSHICVYELIACDIQIWHANIQIWHANIYLSTTVLKLYKPSTKCSTSNQHHGRNLSDLQFGHVKKANFWRYT